MEKNNASPASDLLTNKSAAALLRDSELDIARRKQPPVDLRTVPLEQWDNYLEHDVVMPSELRHFLDLREYENIHATKEFVSLDEKAVHGFEEWTEKFHGVKPPYHIYMSITLQQTGRPWKYVPEAGAYLTGFILGKTVEAGVSPAGQ
jgi:hypothetical protein